MKHDTALPDGTRLEATPKTGRNWNDWTAELKPSSRNNSDSQIIYSCCLRFQPQPAKAMTGAASFPARMAVFSTMKALLNPTDEDVVCMTSTEEYLAYALDLLREAPAATHRKMMGEYLLYSEGVLFGGIYDDRLLFKDVPAARKSFPCEDIPYEGATPMLLVDSETPHLSQQPSRQCSLSSRLRKRTESHPLTLP